MGRPPRYVLPGYPQHVIQRGHSRNAIFLAEKDYSFYLKFLKRSQEKFQCAIHAYVLMTNHVHLLLTPYQTDSISKLMQSLGTSYVQYFNKRYERSGTLWEGRYKAALIDSDRYLLTCYRYIELNPVRAGIVSHPGDYVWSSYHCHAVGKSDPLIRDHVLYADLGEDDEERQRFYRALFADLIDEEALTSIRKTL